ncbi:hypothetical protein GCM10011309_10670 [Litorimonas cladophorae]|uniref:Lipoprotein n=2 Tax=Litorimonas cladophorae TaxID=1220491 RepID=A0A918KI47_9PROT|nr:hypothetical protein GCM10011309_10670 [Litorimonas cladophorae]
MFPKEKELGILGMRKTPLITVIALAGFALSGCGVHKVVTTPVKGAYHATKFVGKTAVGGTKMVGKGLWATGKGVYYVGSVPVKITDAALDTTSKVLTITTQAVDLTGKVVTVSRNVNAARLDAELASLKTAKNVLSVFVDVAA